MEDVPLQEERFLRELNLVAKPAVDESQTKANVATSPAVVSLDTTDTVTWFQPSMAGHRCHVYMYTAHARK